MPFDYINHEEEKETSEKTYNLPPFYSEYSDKILSSVREGYCTLPQLIKRNSFDNVDELSDTLGFMEEEKKIEKALHGQFDAYFEYGKVPAVFYLDGTGKIGWSKKAKPKIVEPKNLGMSTKERNNARKEQITETAAKVKEYASFGWQEKDIAEKLDMSETRLKVLIEHNEIVRHAYFEGRSIRKSINREELQKSATENKKQMRGKAVTIDEQYVKVLAEKGLSQQKIANSIGISYSCLTNNLSKNDSLRAAYDKGRKAHLGKMGVTGQQEKQTPRIPEPSAEVMMGDEALSHNNINSIQDFDEPQNVRESGNLNGARVSQNAVQDFDEPDAVSEEIDEYPAEALEITAPSIPEHIGKAINELAERLVGDLIEYKPFTPPTPAQWKEQRQKDLARAIYENLEFEGHSENVNLWIGELYALAGKPPTESISI